MTNEEIVAEIRKGYSVTEYMQLLYENNLPLIRKFIKPYTAYECETDLLQESYFGLWEAVQHYETDRNVKFMTFARYYILLVVRRYIEKCGSTVRISGYTRHKIARYKKTVQELEQKKNYAPTSAEIADLLGVSEEEVRAIESYRHGVSSLDSPLSVDNRLTLSDTLQADYSLEDEAIDKIYAEHAKSELWGIVERFTTERENFIIKDIFINNQTMAAVAREQGISLDRVRQIKEKALRKLRLGKARSELLQKFDIVEAGVYRNSLNRFNEHSFTSTVEYIAIRRAEIQREYEERKKQIEAIFEQRKRKCL